MESLSDVIRQLVDPARLKQAQEKSRQIMVSPQVAGWRKQHPQVTDAEIKLNINRFYQYLKESNSCRNCPGLERCPNDMQGHYTVLTAENVNGSNQIDDRKKACDKFTAKQAQDALRSRIHSFYIDQRSLYEGYSADEIVDRDEERMESVGMLMDYIFLTKEQGLQNRGLYLVGKFGTGKTFLMCYMLHELAKAGLTGAIVYMPDFSEDLKAMFQDPQKMKETIDLLKETDLLIFDDIGAENMNPWLRDHVMGTILNYRMNRKPTFFTSNYELDALEQHFSFTSKDGEEEFKGQRIMDRIRPFVDVVVIKGSNKRGS